MMRCVRGFSVVAVVRGRVPQGPIINSLAANEFPRSDFVFQLTEEEQNEVVANCDRFNPCIVLGSTFQALGQTCHMKAQHRYAH